MSTIYEVFEFKNGHSLRKSHGPIDFIVVQGYESPREVLAKRGLPGNVHAYGLREIDSDEARDKIQAALQKQEVLLARLYYLTFHPAAV